ncbi:ribonucleoside-diphosphate reductase subunit alpha [Candidatus Kaiserbacteria bacterium RIFCSPHIGHO2_01_FULL_56_24]|uniref:Ribonucleoside-diphosphate reductase n=1 Tax=Candidatus Kaiserbacteria bacterium RIFCSPHIGHO2_01_FULL_56_24 TaxID=1798487 RepID=A0A1F6DEN9_9BACT|nr:MAG: ribonucleoside-diphosphate reductase subunit alpha [Candidatus Kaiserbacteria bacterium RIFCSPHIGHO2_01_FULL_56_24]
MVQLTITKRDGTKEPFNADKINRSIERACADLTDPISMVTQIATETHLTLYDGITTEEMDQATISAAVQNIKEDIEYDKVAVRLLLKTVYRRVIGEYHDDQAELEAKYRAHFSQYVHSGISSGLLDSRMAEKYDLDALAATLKMERDEIFTYAGLSSLMNRYAMKDRQQKPAETPQYFFMRVAMGLAYNETNPTEMAKKFYEKMSRHLYIAGGSTNLGAGTSRPALSNCFLLEVHDDIDHIAKSVADVMKISKSSGGIGVSVTKLRAAGSPLSSSNTVSSGPTPFAKIMDTAIRAIQRGGKKLGALCFYMENWHMDFPEYIDWKHNAGDDYLRMRTANTAVWLSDEFMKRVEAGDDWYMFDPKEVMDLNELYGQAFSKRYGEYVEMAKAGKLRTFKRVPASEQWYQILTSLQSTGHPWLTWKDSVNLRALNNNTGTIHMSNLCTEICLPQDKDNIAVCNLASLNLAGHIEGKQVNWHMLEDSVRLAIRQLDNLIDINVLPIEEAVRSDKENRAVGLGVMGFADALEQLGMPYESGHAADFADRVFEFISYMAIDESANLARERGAYKHFEGSGWSKGMVPLDSIARLEEDRGASTGMKRESKNKQLNWEVLREKVKGGMRNATLMAIAPNANIGLVAGTTPGIDPRFAQVFSRNKISGKYLDLNHNLVKDLKNLSIWDDVKEKIVEQQGDISAIPEIPSYLKQIYKTSFTTSPYAYIEIAARAQKWVDQALSRNMYLENRDMDEMKNLYMTAWKRGLKTTYYLHMKPRHTAEQSTTHVNKGQQIGKRGFANVVASPVFTQEEMPTISPIQQSPIEVQETVLVQSPAPKPVEAAMPAPAAAMPSMRGFASVADQGALPIAPVAQQSLPEVNASPAPEAMMSRMGFSTVAVAVPAVTAVVSTPTVPATSLQASAPSLAPIAMPAAAMPTIVATKKKPLVCPTDPAELALCDACQ